MSTVTTTASSFPAAELDRRFYAFTIDGLLAVALYGAAAWAAWVLFLDDGSLGAGLGLIAGAVLLVGVVLAVVLGTFGTSPGKAAVGVRVVDAVTGTPIGVGRALLRVLVVGVALVPVGMGVAMLAWTAVMDIDRLRRGWHDHLAGSVVVDVRPAAVEEEAAPERPRTIVNLTAMRLVPASPTPPREIPARVRRSRWATGPANAAAPEPPATLTAASTPVATGPVVPDVDHVPPPAPTDTPAAGTARPRPPAAPPAAPPAPVPAPVPVARPEQDPDALSTPPGAAPPAARRADPLSDPLSAPLSDSLAPPPATRPGPRHAALEDAGASARPVWSVAFDTGETFTVEGFTLVGRNPEARPGEPVKRLVALPSQDMSLSKTHAQFQVVPDGALVVMDRGSTNGSILIRGGVPRELGPGRPAALRDGDRIRFGDREMRVVRVA